MKRIVFVILSLLLISGCASQRQNQISLSEIIAHSTSIAGNSNLHISQIPSHGKLGDSLAISANGGGNANQLREAIQQIISSGGGSLVVTSTNPELAKAVIEGAIGNMDSKKKDIILIYAGSTQFSNSTQSLVESKGMQYGFVDIAKKM